MVVAILIDSHRRQLPPDRAPLAYSDSSYYQSMTFETEIAERSLRADELVREGRAQLRQVVLDGHRRGLSQRRIAALTNRSQPEVSRLLREIDGLCDLVMARAASEAPKRSFNGDDDFRGFRTLITAINDFRDLTDSAEIQEFLRRPRPTRPALGHASRGRRSPGLQATRSHRTEVEPPGTVGVLVVPGRRWRSPGRTHHGAHTHRLLTSGYLAGRVCLPDGVRGTDEHHRFRSRQDHRAAHRAGSSFVCQGRRGPAVCRGRSCDGLGVRHSAHHPRHRRGSSPTDHGG